MCKKLIEKTQTYLRNYRMYEEIYKKIYIFHIYENKESTV